jgi:hypothetical protein
MTHTPRDSLTFRMKAANKIPMYKTPEQMSSKASFIDRRPPSFKINNRLDKGSESRITRNSEVAKPLPGQAEMAKKAKLISLKERIKALEQRLEEKDKEIAELNTQTRKIVKDRDACTRYAFNKSAQV